MQENGRAKPLFRGSSVGLFEVNNSDEIMSIIPDEISQERTVYEMSVRLEHESKKEKYSEMKQLRAMLEDGGFDADLEQEDNFEIIEVQILHFLSMGEDEIDGEDGGDEYEEVVKIWFGDEGDDDSELWLDPEVNRIKSLLVIWFTSYDLDKMYG